MSRLAGARVLVTGAAGFVGPHLARALAARGAIVHGVGLGEPPAGAPLASWTGVDLLAPAPLHEAVGRAAPDVVVHLAGQSSAARSFAEPAETFRANVLGTRGLLAAVRARAPRARVLIASTSEVYGPVAPGTRATEDAPTNPVSPYALSKLAAERAAAELAARDGLDVVIARPFGHAGPGQSPAFMLPAFAQQIAAIEAGRAGPVLRVGNLDVTRDLSDVRDVVEGYVALLERGAPGATYNLCRGEGVHLRALVGTLAGLARTPVRVEVDPARLRPADLPYLVGDPERTAQACGWRVTRPLETTLRDVLAEWRAAVG